jgi:SAM-dependent methyltransferase
VTSGDLWNQYDEVADRYEQHAEDSAYNAHYDRPAVLAALGPVVGLDVLDAACGPGFLLQRLIEQGARAVGFDASPAMVALARRRAGDAARVDVARLDSQLPYGDGDFDRVVCALAIHHVPDRAATFAELRRVVRPGGAVVVSTTHPTADWLRAGGSYFDRVLMTEHWDSMGQSMSAWREPLSDLVAAALSAGFVLDLLDEPRPTATMRTRHPETYETLTRQPGFIVLRLRPAPTPGSPGASPENST